MNSISTIFFRIIISSLWPVTLIPLGSAAKLSPWRCLVSASFPGNLWYLATASSGSTAMQARNVDMDRDGMVCGPSLKNFVVIFVLALVVLAGLSGLYLKPDELRINIDPIYISNHQMSCTNFVHLLCIFRKSSLGASFSSLGCGDILWVRIWLDQVWMLSIFFLSSFHLGNAWDFRIKPEVWQEPLPGGHQLLFRQRMEFLPLLLTSDFSAMLVLQFLGVLRVLQIVMETNYINAAFFRKVCPLTHAIKCEWCKHIPYPLFFGLNSTIVQQF